MSCRLGKIILVPKYNFLLTWMFIDFSLLHLKYQSCIQWEQSQNKKFITVYYSLNTVGVVSNFIAAYNYTNLVV